MISRQPLQRLLHCFPARRTGIREIAASGLQEWATSISGQRPEFQGSSNGTKDNQ
jgi:hypothetical protein